MANDLLQQELLLNERENRYTLFPIVHQDIWSAYKTAEASFWTAEELDLHHDLADWDRLNKNEQHFIEVILAFFSGADGIVNENLAENFNRQIRIPEVNCFYCFQMTIENVHNEVYSLLIDTLIRDEKRRYELLHAIDTIP